MTDYRNHYKKNPFTIGNTENSRSIRTEQQDIRRKKQRQAILNKNRGVPDLAINTQQNNGTREPGIVESRQSRFLKWKTERDRLKKLEQSKKKPAFKVGVVHHKIYSPAQGKPEKQNNSVKSVSDPPKRITKATEKRLLAKAALQNNAGKPTKLHSNKRKQQTSSKSQPSFAPADCKFEAPAGIAKIPLFGTVYHPDRSSCRISDFVFTPPKTRHSARRGNTTIFHTEEKETLQKVSENVEENEQDAGTLGDSSIEGVSLKLSFDDEESQKSNSAQSKEKNTSILNASGSSRKTKSPFSNSTPTSTKTDSPTDPAFFSPYVVSSRGKNNARKEQQIKRGLGRCSGDGIPTKENVMQSLNISIEDEERTAQYFHFILNKEIERLNALCDKWTEIKSEPDIMEDAQYQINQAIGQTTLLINKKFERFRGLVSDCESGKGEMLVTCRDLQGFWDMMYMEVKNCDSRFETLEKLRSNNWKEQPIEKPVTKKKTTSKKKPVVAKPSSFRTFLAGKKKSSQENQDIANTESGRSQRQSIRIQIANNKSSPSGISSVRRSKSIGGRTPMSAKHEKARQSLLQKVQLSETSKRIRSPLAIMKISKLCKTAENDLNTTTTSGISTQTPSKSILKQSSQNSVKSESRPKSMHKVNFNDCAIVKLTPIDSEVKTKMNLAAALARIDSYDFDSNPEKIERRLSFSDSSSDEFECSMTETKHTRRSNRNSMNKTPAKDPDTEIQRTTPLQESSFNESFNTSDRKSNTENESDKLNETFDTVPTINILSATPFASSLEQVEIQQFNRASNTPSKTSESPLDVRKTPPLNLSKKILRRQNAMDESQDSIEVETVRTLRNRSVIISNTPKATRNSIKIAKDYNSEPEQKENKTPRTRRKSSLKVRIKDTDKLDLEDGMTTISLDETNNKRRSRRSVKFAVKDCAGCGENKPALPMTPHVRRSMARRSKSVSTPGPNKELSPETQNTPPERVRRSRNKK